MTYITLTQKSKFVRTTVLHNEKCKTNGGFSKLWYETKYNFVQIKVPVCSRTKRFLIIRGHAGTKNWCWKTLATFLHVAETMRKNDLKNKKKNGWDIGKKLIKMMCHEKKSSSSKFMAYIDWNFAPRAFLLRMKSNVAELFLHPSKMSTKIVGIWLGNIFPTIVAAFYDHLAVNG